MEIMARFKYLSIALLLVMLGHSANAINVKVVDGDTLNLDGQKIRLAGLDAPELKQKCKHKNSTEWDCGLCASAFLEGLISSREITCHNTGIDYYKHAIATCYAGSVEINKEIVRAGYAVAYKKYSNSYSEDEAYAKHHKNGIWAGTFDTPESHRKEKRKAKP